MALTEAAKEAIHIKHLANHVGMEQNNVPLQTDNQAAISWAQNPIVNSKSKHIALKEHFIRETGEIKLDYKLPYRLNDGRHIHEVSTWPKVLSVPRTIGTEESLVRGSVEIHESTSSSHET